MAEVFVCMLRVEEEERVMGSETALRCGYEGCETSWVSVCDVLFIQQSNTYVLVNSFT